MEISIEKIKSWFEKISRGKPSYDKEGIKPSRDWKVMIAVAAIVFCLEAALALFIYFQIENGAWFQTPEDTALTQVFINQNLLQQVADQIDAKAAVYSGASTTPVALDPSL